MFNIKIWLTDEIIGEAETISEAIEFIEARASEFSGFHPNKIYLLSDNLEYYIKDAEGKGKLMYHIDDLPKGTKRV